MATGTTLVVLREMLKAEIGDEMDEAVSSANDDRYNRLMATTQEWLVGKDARLLPPKVRAEVALVAGQRLYELPEGIDLQALAYPAFVKLAQYRFYLEFGISQEHYNAFSPEADGPRRDPVLRWDVVQDGDESKLEVWPIPASEQTLIFEGKPVLGELEGDDDVCVVDGLLIVLFTAAKILATRKGGASQACLTQATDRLQSLKGKRPSQFETFSLRGGGRTKCRDDRAMVGVTDFSVSYIRFYNGMTQMKADDGLWHDFQLVTDQGQVTIQINPVGMQ